MSADEAELTGGQAQVTRAPLTPHSQLVGELVELRNEQGATLPRVSDCPTLVSLGRAWRKAGNAPTASDDVAASQDLLQKSIEDLHERDRDLLSAQFAFTHSQSSREQREAAYLKEIMRKGAPGSMSSFDRWSRAGMRQVAQRIIDRAMGTDTSMLMQEREGQSDVEPFSVDALRWISRFREGRLPRDNLFEVTITSLVEGTHLFLTHPAYFSDPREGVIEIVPEFGCELAGPTYFENGHTFGLLRVGKSLSAGESFTFTVRAITNSDVESDPYIMLVPDYSAAIFVLEVEFRPDAIPQELWRFGNLPYFTAQSRRHRRQERLRSERPRYIHESWQGIQKGMCYGIDWEW